MFPNRVGRLTRAAAQLPQHVRKQVGNAVWLWALLIHFTLDDWTGETAAYVAGGNLVSEGELAARLLVKPRTVANWRRKLRAAGYLDWTIKPGVGRVFVLSALVARSLQANLTPQPVATEQTNSAAQREPQARKP